jgi:hypothetical protein
MLLRATTLRRLVATSRTAFTTTPRCFSIGSTEEPLPEEGEWKGCNRGFMNPLQVTKKGSDVLTDPLFNKGLAFKSGERDRLCIRGLLPPRVVNIRKLWSKSALLLCILSLMFILLSLFQL